MSEEAISVRYDEQGISRWDRGYGLWHCCHCDGLAYLSYQDRLTTEARSLQFDGRERLLQEAGDAFIVGFEQLLHYRCGVYLGNGREMSEEDLERLARLQDLSEPVRDEIHAHYLLTQNEARAYLFDHGLRGDALQSALTPPADDADATTTAAWYNALRQRGVTYDVNKERYQRFTQSEIDDVHARLRLTEADWRQIRAANRDYMAIPDIKDLERTLDYVSMRAAVPNGLDVHCQRCLLPVSWEAQGMMLRARPQPLFWHHVCYDAIALNHAREARQAMYALYPQEDHWRLNRLELTLQHAPVSEFTTWLKSTSQGAPDYEAFLLYWERALNL